MTIARCLQMGNPGVAAWCEQEQSTERDLRPILLRSGLSALRAWPKAMWVATAIASEENQAAVGKPVGQKQVLAKKQWRPPTGFEPGSDQ